MRVRAVWNDTVLAESEKTIVVEGNHYFPRESIHPEYFHENPRHTICPWKGVASYYDVEVDGRVNRSAAWYYPDPSPAARHIQDYVAFWNGVRVEKVMGGIQDQDESNSLLDRVRGSFFGN